jgi:hypothetical protein
VIGGVARILHGSAQATGDSDVLVARDAENLKNLAAALDHLEARLMAGHEVLAFGADLDRLRMGLNSSWMTRAGQLDTFGEVEGGVCYDEVIENAIEVVTAAGNRIKIASLEQLLEMKRHLRRPKDVRDMEELEQLKMLHAELDQDEKK